MRQTACTSGLLYHGGITKGVKSNIGGVGERIRRNPAPYVIVRHKLEVVRVHNLREQFLYH